MGYGLCTSCKLPNLTQLDITREDIPYTRIIDVYMCYFGRITILSELNASYCPIQQYDGVKEMTSCTRLKRLSRTHCKVIVGQHTIYFGVLRASRDLEMNMC